MSNEDPGAVFDAHVRAEFVERSVEATMATMTDAPYVTHVPVMTGGRRPLAGRHRGDAGLAHRGARPRDR